MLLTFVHFIHLLNDDYNDGGGDNSDYYNGNNGDKDQYFKSDKIIERNQNFIRFKVQDTKNQQIQNDNKNLHHCYKSSQSQRQLVSKYETLIEYQQQKRNTLMLSSLNSLLLLFLIFIFPIMITEIIQTICLLTKLAKIIQ